MNRTQFVQLITRTDEVGMHAVGRALVHLLNRQTQDEQETSDTRHQNARGFNTADARRGTITAKYYLKHRTLQDWQIEYWLQEDARGALRLGKYWRQIAEEAAARKAAKVVDAG